MTLSVKMQCRLLSAEWLMKFADEAEMKLLKLKQNRCYKAQKKCSKEQKESSKPKEEQQYVKAKRSQAIAISF